MSFSSADNSRLKPSTGSPWLKRALRPYRQPAVRDLAWCLMAPPLLRQIPAPHRLLPDNQMMPLDNATQAWLAQLEEKPQPLLEHLQKLRSTRLGIYYEALWHFYFSRQPHWQLLAYNQQIHTGQAAQKRTRGAFDFLCAQGGNYWHLEAAIKFYLYHQPPQGGPSWLGPDARDSLAGKYQHLLQQQLPLSASNPQNPGYAWLRQAFPLATHWHTGLLMQGYLFYPWHSAISAIPTADALHAQHLRGYWLHYRDIDALLDQYPQAAWYLLPREHWLAPLSICAEQLASKHSLHHNLQQQALAQRPLMLVRLEALSPVNEPLYTAADWHFLEERERYMLVANDWPSRST